MFSDWLADLETKDNATKIVQIKLEAWSSSIDIDRRNRHFWQDVVILSVKSYIIWHRILLERMTLWFMWSLKLINQDVCVICTRLLLRQLLHQMMLVLMDWLLGKKILLMWLCLNNVLYRCVQRVFLNTSYAHLYHILFKHAFPSVLWQEGHLAVSVP